MGFVTSGGFESVPKLLFFKRVGLLAAGLGLWVALAVNFGVGGPGMERQLRSPATIAIPQISSQFYPQLRAVLRVRPEACRTGRFLSEFQEQSCRDFDTALWIRVAIGLFPVALALGVFLIGLDSLALIYRRMKKRVDRAQALTHGRVESPAEARTDFFSWFYCFRVVAVELPHQGHAKVYLPAEAPMPLPGQTLALFDGGRIFGRRRLVGTLYAPHLAVIAGLRQR